MVAYSLTPGTSYCDAGGRYVFLDVESDRYFCLSPQLEHAFAALSAGDQLTAEDRAGLRELVRRGILNVGCGTNVELSPATAVRARCSAVDSPETATTGHVAVAAMMLVRIKRSLRRRPLADLIAKVRDNKRERKAPRISGNRRRLQLALIADSFRRAALITGSLDQCLAVSLAIMHRILGESLDGELIFGVKLRPFQAHAWVQSDDLLISDSLDTIAPFTPILVV
jgi:hypothetical protein